MYRFRLRTIAYNHSDGCEPWIKKNLKARSKANLHILKREDVIKREDTIKYPPFVLIFTPSFV